MFDVVEKRYLHSPVNPVERLAEDHEVIRKSREVLPVAKYASRPKIVLIEDSAADVFLIRKALESKNIECDVTHFEDGDVALAALTSSGGNRELDSPDLILLDLNLPRSDGLDILRMIRMMPRLADVPVAILTSSEAPSDKHRAFTIGAVRYILKPLQLEDFLDQVGGVIDDLLSPGRALAGGE